MLIELGTGALLFWTEAEVFRRPLFVAALILLAVIWLSTFLVQVPLHNALVGGFDPQVHASLVRSNWIRTLAWSVRGLLLFAILWAGSAERLA
jgi:hypothetical protein